MHFHDNFLVCCAYFLRIHRTGVGVRTVLHNGNSHSLFREAEVNHCRKAWEILR